MTWLGCYLLTCLKLPWEFSASQHYSKGNTLWFSKLKNDDREIKRYYDNDTKGQLHIYQKAVGKDKDSKKLWQRLNLTLEEESRWESHSFWVIDCVSETSCQDSIAVDVHSGVWLDILKRDRMNKTKENSYAAKHFLDCEMNTDSTCPNVTSKALDMFLSVVYYFIFLVQYIYICIVLT